MPNSSTPQTRLSVCAGSFYPADPAELLTWIERCLVTPSEDVPPPRILIVPHAGYLYSGAVAGAGFAQVKNVSRVILLGVSHYAAFDHAAVYTGDFWKTPLGKVATDHDTIGALLRSSAAFRADNTVHNREHGLEVQLPFLQVVLHEFQLVPLLLGGEDGNLPRRVAATLAGVLDEHTLLVVSSDLSHYPSQADAERVDRCTLDAILTLDPARFQQAIAQQLSSGVRGLFTCACGAKAIDTALRVAQTLRLETAQVLAYTNSGEVSDDSRQVVGYASVGFYGATNTRQ
jgi:AmmeMemoRadiSam system protein B